MVKNVMRNDDECDWGARGWCRTHTFMGKNVAGSSMKWGKKKDGLDGWIYSRKTHYNCNKTLTPSRKIFLPDPGPTIADHQEPAPISSEDDINTQGSTTVHVYSDTPDSGLVSGIRV